ncbi:MAG TPA: STAS domain-containing protein [Candidatus Obscuribacterales bacterium]
MSEWMNLPNVRVFQPDRILSTLTGRDLLNWVNDTLADGTTHLVIDCRDLGFMDVGGLGALAGALGRVRRASGTLTLHGIPDQPQMVLKMADMLNAFDPLPT